VTSVAGASNYVIARHAIEGVDTLSGKTATLSFWAKADANKNIAVELQQYFGTGGSPSTSVNDAGSTYDSRSASLGQQSGTFDIAQVQLEEGSAATPFEQRPIGLEFGLCERYYQNLGSLYPGHINTGNTTAIRFVVPFSVYMRTSPTVTFSNVSSGFSASNIGGAGQAKRLNIEVTASARTDFRPRIDAVVDAEL
jgi:hypothetical protein